MSRSIGIPDNFLESDDEQPKPKISPKKETASFPTRVAKMTINAGTSSTMISDSRVDASDHLPIKENSPAIPMMNQNEYLHLLRKIDDMQRVLNGLTNRLQATYGLVADVKKELDILKVSSARFTSTPATSGFKSTRKPKFLS